MALSEKRKESMYKYAKENLKRIPLDVPKPEYEAIKTHAARRDESVNGFVKRAISETMERDTFQKPTGTLTEAATALEGILSSDTLKAAQRAAQKNGEDVPSFIARSVDMEVRRDKAAWSLGVNPATGKEETKGGKVYE